MRRQWFILLGILVLIGGTLSYQRHREVQTIGQEVYKELDGDGFPPLPGVLDDPIFKEVPPPPSDRPVSLGRYRPQEPKPEEPVKGTTTPTQVAPKPVEPIALEPVKPSPGEPAPPKPTPVKPSPSLTPASTSAHAPSAQQPQPPLAPLSFLERVRTDVKIHVLLMGNDEQQLGQGRADVLVVLTFDPVKRLLTFTSIPRDTRTFIPEHQVAKINAAYAIGGPTLQTITVERFLGLPMDKFVEVSMAGFQEAIDLVGGVTVNPPFAFELDGQRFEPGYVKLNGEQALAYSRMRKQDPRGDLGRNARQQQVLRSLMSALGKLPPNQFNELIAKLQGYVRTNFSPSEVVELRQAHSYLLDRQAQVAVAGSNRKLNGQWYYVVSDQERQRLHVLLR